MDPNGTVTFTLHVLANPAPMRWNWTKDGVPVGSGFTPSSQDQTYKLLVDEVESTDYGTYACGVANSIGSTMFIFLLEPSGEYLIIVS